MDDNAGALDETITQLQELGRLERIDSARLQMLRSMAGALDEDSSNAALWRQYREALRELTADDRGGSVDKALSSLFGPVRDSPSS